tara:strand:- start:1562 stop:2932 length:1371 start_codon:yes stop_codon:yes gene_type:complete
MAIQINGNQIVDNAIVSAKIANTAVTAAKLGSDLAGSGLSGGNGSALSIGSAAVTNAMLAGSIADSKMAQITTADKVAGSALQLAGSGGLENSSGIKISDSGVTNAMLAGSIAFSKLADSTNICRLDQAETIGAVWSYGSNIPTVSADPSSDNQLARKAYVDAVAQGLDTKDSVKAATTANITLSGTQTIDGVSILADDRVLVKNQSTGTENGIYVCAGGSWSRASDFASGTQEAGAYCWVEQGTVNADTAWVCTNNKGSDTVGTHAITFGLFARAGELVAGDGLDKSGATLSLDLAANKGLEIVSTELAVKVNAATGIQVDSNGVGVNLASDAGMEFDSNQLRAKLDGSSLARAAGGLSVADNGVSLVKCSWRAYRDSASGDGSATFFDLSRAISANFADAVQVYRNGIFLDKSGSPSDMDEFSVSATGGSGGVCRITFGAAPGNGDKIRFIYLA